MDFSQAYDTCFRKTYNYVYYGVIHRETAEDIVSETFLRAWRNWSAYDPSKASVQTWLYAIARNLVADHFRRNHACRSIEDIEDLVDPWGTEEEVLRLEDNRALRGMLARLSPLDRQLVYLKYVEAMRNKDIASLLGISETLVSTRVSRALSKLKALCAQPAGTRA